MNFIINLEVIQALFCKLMCIGWLLLILMNQLGREVESFLLQSLLLSTMMGGCMLCAIFKKAQLLLTLDYFIIQQQQGIVRHYMMEISQSVITIITILLNNTSKIFADSLVEAKGQHS